MLLRGGQPSHSGVTFRDILNALRYTAKIMANDMGVSQAHIYDMLNDRRYRVKRNKTYRKHRRNLLPSLRAKRQYLDAVIREIEADL